MLPLDLRFPKPACKAVIPRSEINGGADECCPRWIPACKAGAFADSLRPHPMAHRAGLEPAIARLTAGSFTIKLSMNKLVRQGDHYFSNAKLSHMIMHLAPASCGCVMAKLHVSLHYCRNGSGCGKCSQRGFLRKVMGLLTLTSSLTRN